MVDDGREDDGESMPAVTRRTTLAVGAGLLTTGLTGCVGNQGLLPGSGDGEDEAVDGSVGEPVEVPEDANCAVCNMMPAKFPDWNAQLRFEDDERAHFCSPGCMAAFQAVPDNFADGRTQEEIEGVWVHDFDTTELIDGLLASYVLETDAKRVDDPMMVNPLPFADREAAEAYAEQYDDLGDEDVIELAEFDRELAEQYRSKFF